MFVLALVLLGCSRLAYFNLNVFRCVGDICVDSKRQGQHA